MKCNPTFLKRVYNHANILFEELVKKDRWLRKRVFAELGFYRKKEWLTK